MDKILLKVIVCVGVVLFYLTVVYAAKDPLAVKDAVVKIKEKVLSSESSWNALISEISSAQDEAKEFSEYKDAYDKLLSLKDELNAYDNELSGYLSELNSYREEHPDMTETEELQFTETLEFVDTVSVTITSYLMRIASIEVKQAELLKQAPPEKKEVPTEFEVRGELSVLTGNGTLTDRDRHYLMVSERYKNKKDQVFTFLQRYDNDHSFIDRRRTVFSMAQELPVFLGGELEMRQSYEDYDDLSFSANSRKQLNLDFDFSRPFAGGRTQTFFSYHYTSKNFRSISPRSYLNHWARFEIIHEISPKVIGNAYWHMIDSHYALTNFNGYNATYLGAGFQFTPNPGFIWNLKYQSLENSYDVRKASAFFEEYFLLEGHYQPNNDVLVEGDLRFLDHNRRRTPGSSYDEDRFRLRYNRSFSESADGDFRFEWKNKDFDVASPNDFTYLRWQAYLNFYPSERLRWYYNFDFYDYDYSSLARSYNRMYNRLGFNYHFANGVLWTSEFALTDQNYSTNSARNYTITDFLADLYVPISRRDNLRFFLTLSRLDQSAHLSVNDYTATDFGVEYTCRLSENYRLKLIYTYDRRDYKNQADIRDTAFETRLNFDF